MTLLMTTLRQRSRFFLTPLDVSKQIWKLNFYLSTCFSSHALRARCSCLSFRTRFSCLPFEARLTFRTLRRNTW